LGSLLRRGTPDVSTTPLSPQRRAYPGKGAILFILKNTFQLCDKEEGAILVVSSLFSLLPFTFYLVFFAFLRHIPYFENR
jgi:hypothetical protein